MSDELEQERAEDETEDVEAHKRKFQGSDEPAADDEDTDDVEAHKRLTQ